MWNSVVSNKRRSIISAGKITEMCYRKQLFRLREYIYCYSTDIYDYIILKDAIDRFFTEILKSVKISEYLLTYS